MAQIEILQPQFIFFVTSPSYDKYLNGILDWVDGVAGGRRQLHQPLLRSHG